MKERRRNGRDSKGIGEETKIITLERNLEVEWIEKETRKELETT